ncbi:signal transducer and activator of transcription 5B [Lepeophtheirus salmonis]|uniref:Signal transducer and activator of transcription n=1 Tax=Lepeophtheirus salmonis TaxID=72036 RepID=A0A0K2TTQ5_LEPSM|nr:signal transducer and activator of transcription 5B-like [Lepeophtheirus salmonis]XP_040575664.1 signal transducer and activator of transcription 5B-like [Lepeophtheirus salmonis]
MSLWDQTRQLPPEMLKLVENRYGDRFPFQVRLELASWIEEKFDPNTPIVSDETPANIGSQLLAQLEARVESMPNEPEKFFMKNTLGQNLLHLRQLYGNDPASLYITVRQCLDYEMNINQQVLSNSNAFDTRHDTMSRIRTQIELLKARNIDTSTELSKCHQSQEAFSVEYYSFCEKKKKMTAIVLQHGEQHPDVVKNKSQMDLLEKKIKERYLMLSAQRNELVNSFFKTYHDVKEIQSIVLDTELIRWKRDQQLAGNGLEMNFSLDILQEWCEGLAEIIWTMRQQIKQLDVEMQKLADPKNTNHIPELLSGVTELLSNLVTGTFIIEKQPPQVMKTNTRFTATVRLLVGGVLNVHMATPQVSVSIVSESQSNQLLTTPPTIQKKKEDYSSGEILNGQGTMEYHSTSKQVSVSFRNLQLKKIKRTEKKGTESVMDEKFAVLFWTEFLVGELKFQLWTLSLPVVVIVHGNQEPQALATVTWDNAFAEWGRRPFVIPDKVPWGKAGQALNMKWTAACGSPLTEDNLYYLACKVFRNNNLPRNMSEVNQMQMTWSQFCKETLPGRSFTFWEWFYRILLLTSNHMQQLWKEGFIMGFVSKQAAEAMLISTNTSGCFLLRFSDSELGGITIGYLRQPYNAPPSVNMVAPFTSRDLCQRSMADVIFDIEALTLLYPDTPKLKFRQFCSNIVQGFQPTANGYVKHMLVTHVEGMPKNEIMDGASSFTFSEANSPPALCDASTDGMDFDDNIGIDVANILGLTGGFLDQNNSF